MDDTSNNELQQKAVFKDAQIQKDLNTPMRDSRGMSAEDQVFLDLVMGLVKDGKIKIYVPSSLLNYEIYDKLPLEAKGKADVEAYNLLATVREIKSLYDADFKDSYQISYLVNKLRLTKERIESEGGDLFII